MIGGSPLRILRVSDHGAGLVDDWARGAAVGPDPAGQVLARRLVSAGMAHPVLQPEASRTLTVGAVIPTRDDAGGLHETIAAIDAHPQLTAIVVVDDGSRDTGSVTRTAEAASSEGLRSAGTAIRVVRRDRSGGPAAARNTGWAELDTDLVAFVDADVVPSPGWLDPLIRHFGDAEVAGAAPRVRPSEAVRGSSLLDRYEARQSPLDMGVEPARVAPDGRVRYVPTATLVVRRAALSAVGGFDEALRYGEDVDLVWRLCEAGYTVRFEPDAEVFHANRGSWSGLAGQRFRYGSSAAALDRRHPGSVAPVEVNAWTLGAYGLAVLGGRRGTAAATATAVGSAAALMPRLWRKVDHPAAEAARLGGLGHLLAARWLARAGLRSWLPILVAASIVSRRARRLLALAAVAVPASDWLEQRPAIDPVRWTALRVLDDAAYCAGAWYGCGRHRSWRVLVPKLVGIEGLRSRWPRSRTRS